MVWYSRLLKNFPQFIVIHTVKGFGIVNKAEGKFIPRYLILFVTVVNGIDSLIVLSDFSLLVYRNAMCIDFVSCNFAKFTD